MRLSPDVSIFPRKPSFDSPSPPLDPRTAVPATFFLSCNPHAAESTHDSCVEDTGDYKDNTYGVQSLADMLSQSEAIASSHSDIPVHQPISHQSQDLDDGKEPRRSDRRSTLKPFETISRDSSMPPPADIISRPLTPLIPDEPSFPTYPAIGSDEEDRPGPSPHIGPANVSQLIMPSIKMPSRRPFTERGKAMGRFKILLAGAPGSGKTSLIKSIVQKCEDIVHVDALPATNNSPGERRRPPRPHTSANPTRGPAITEIYASTKPYPSWWSDLEDSRVLRRRKSIGEIVLERNLCFVDTPTTSLSRAGHTDAIVQYLRQQLHRASNSVAAAGIDFQNLLAGNGGSQVDAILYLISRDSLSKDIECVRKLCELSNVIPVIAKSDMLSPEELSALKAQFHQQAQVLGVRPFLFGDLPPFNLEGTEPQLPYAVSSEQAVDLEIMDASTLMSPDYIQPLITSELDILVQKLFDRDNLAWMRHSAAKKLITQRGDFPYDPAIRGPPHNVLSGNSAGWRAACATSTAPSYAMARLTDHTQQEERMAQVRLVDWATNLQQSLQNERDRYAALARGDRAVWLTERLNECVIDGSLVPISKTSGFCGLHVSNPTDAGDSQPLRSSNEKYTSGFYVNSFGSHDPLGVVDWIDDMRRRGWMFVQIVGSVGLVGGLAFWFARSLGVPSRSLSGLPLDWCGGSER
ncbi:hypothetical protein N7468_003331 [Penicillium chermesinum]|uniref:Septin-type G domain-containing protein n=1 Tax=Penicillium chermesinum TaxID=63820 RepID=A0A9W9P6G8_9EURO|nr:uncharacterized protein N7468_003331 [Penicillium chermesinum]KAJ5238712.1 hypothetical protein N7468_003331 [Penicillium chermesinum]